MTVILDEIAKNTDNICMLYNPNFEPSAGKRYNSLEFLLLNYYNKNLTYKRDSDFCVYFIRGGIKSQDIDPNYSFYKKIGEAEIYKKNWNWPGINTKALGWSKIYEWLFEMRDKMEDVYLDS